LGSEGGGGFRGGGGERFAFAGGGGCLVPHGGRKGGPGGESWKKNPLVLWKRKREKSLPSHGKKSPAPRKRIKRVGPNPQGGPFFKKKGKKTKEKKKNDPYGGGRPSSLGAAKGVADQKRKKRTAIEKFAAPGWEDPRRGAKKEQGF